MGTVTTLPPSPVLTVIRRFHDDGAGHITPCRAYPALVRGDEAEEITWAEFRRLRQELAGHVPGTLVTYGPPCVLCIP